jgi:hypothetical protein
MFVEGYYLAGDQVKAKNLIEDIAEQYEGRFTMIANFSQNDQQLVFDRIKEEILDFQQLIDKVENFDQDLADSLQLRFDKSMSQFKINEKVD